MRIAIRLWLAIVLAIASVLALGVAYRLDAERRQILEVTVRDRRFFAHAIQAALARGVVVDPLEEARAMLDHEQVVTAHIEASLVSHQRGAGLSPPHAPAAAAAALDRGTVSVVVVGHEILTYIPVDRSAPRAAIELREPRAVDEVVERLGLRSLVLQTVALALAVGALTFVLVGLLVGRPLARLARHAVRVGRGDLAARVPVAAGARGEVADLTRAMNAMTQALGDARRALDEAEAERSLALDRLRHADRLRTVGELASTLAHELGTPLNVVSGHARSIEEDPGSPDEVRGSAQVIVDQARRMTSILRGLLDFSRKRGSRGRFGVLGVVRRAADALAPLMRSRSVEVLVEGDPGVTVRADAQQVVQVVANLLTNAAHAMPRGGTIRIRVEEVSATPPVGVFAGAGPYARIEVQDEGEGIAQDDLPHVFEAFFTRKSEGEGTGLGLAVVDGIVRDHEGFVTVHSEPSRGTRFAVHLPVGDRAISIPPP